MKKASTAEKRQHYYLVVGKIFYVQKVEGEDTPAEFETNAIVTNDKLNQFGFERIAATQQTIQMQMAQVFKEEMLQIKIVNVVIQNLIYLGHFTSAEFNELPPGLKVQARAEQETRDLAQEQLDRILKEPKL